MSVFSQKNEKVKDPYRNRFTRIVKSQESDISDLNDDLIDRVNFEVKKNINDESKIISSFVPILTFWGGSLIKLMTKYNVSTSEIIVDQQKELISKTYGSFEYDRLLKQASNNVVTDMAKNFPKRIFPGSNASIGAKIVTVQGSAKKTLMDILTLGIERGFGAKEISEMMDNFIKPVDSKKWIGPYDWYRDKFGIKVNIKPPTRVAGSVHFNSIRIARTEINHTYRMTTVDLNRKQPWVEGFEWNLSPAHPEYDICDEWIKGNPYTEAGIRELGHPYCMCYVTTKLKKI